MSIADIVILAIIALAAVLGCIKGIVRTLLRLAELIVTVGLGAVAAMIPVWAGIVDLSSLQTGEIDYMALLLPLGLFLGVFIVTMIVCDYIVNKLIYKKWTIKKRIVDHVVGMLIAIIIAVAVLFGLFAFLHVLYEAEGFEYAPYIQKLADSGPICGFFFDNNPFNALFGKLFAESGVVKAITKILNMFWPNFEYLA